MVALSATLPLLALLVAGVVEAAATGRIGRNSAIGIRLPATLASDAAWTAGHRAARRPAWAGFTLTTAVAVASFFTAEQASAVLGVAVLVVFVAALVVASIAAVRAAERAVRR